MLTPANANPALSAAHFTRNAIVIGGLWISVLVTGVGVVYSTYLSRQLVSELNSLHHETTSLHVQWGQYLIEQSTWATYNRVEKVATDQLNMSVPAHENIIMVKK